MSQALDDRPTRIPLRPTMTPVVNAVQNLQRLGGSLSVGRPRTSNPTVRGVPLMTPRVLSLLAIGTTVR